MLISPLAFYRHLYVNRNVPEMNILQFGSFLPHTKTITVCSNLCTKVFILFSKYVLNKYCVSGYYLVPELQRIIKYNSCPTSSSQSSGNTGHHRALLVFHFARDTPAMTNTLCAIHILNTKKIAAEILLELFKAFV